MDVLFYIAALWEAIVCFYSCMCIHMLCRKSTEYMFDHGFVLVAKLGQ